MNVEAETRFELEVATLTDVGTEREHNEDHCGELVLMRREQALELSRVPILEGLAIAASGPLGK